MIVNCQWCGERSNSFTDYITFHINNCKGRPMSKKPKYIERYKIHAYDTVTGLRSSSNNNVFYETFGEAHNKCKEYLRTQQNSPVDAYVIMKTYAIVQRAAVPTVAYQLMQDGKVLEI
jgi:hypothetical protein